MATDAEFLAAFEAQQWPLDQWHHRDHIRLAYLYLRALPFDEAAEKLRTGIKAHNAAHNIPDGPAAGYHETITIAWLHLVKAILDAYGPAADGEAFCDAHPELLEKYTLRLFYSRERIMSPEAKARFLEPDLASLPTIPAREGH